MQKALKPTSYCIPYVYAVFPILLTFLQYTHKSKLCEYSVIIVYCNENFKKFFHTISITII